MVLDTHQYLMVAEALGCEQNVESYTAYIRGTLAKDIEEMQQYFDVICGEWCLFNSLACGCDTMGGRSVLNGEEGSGQELMDEMEKARIYRALARAPDRGLGQGKRIFFTGATSF